MDLLIAVPFIVLLEISGPILLGIGLFKAFRSWKSERSAERTVRALIRAHAPALAAQKKETVYADGRGVLRMEGWAHAKRRFRETVVVGDLPHDPSLIDAWIEEEIAAVHLRPARA